jgi:flagellar basal-body rod modification protein FlgD
MSLSASDVLSKLYTPSTSKSSSGTDTSKESLTSTTSLGKDDFLKLLLAQMQNQDPLNPADETQFVAELAQFSSLEQMSEMNTNLDNLVTSNAATTDSINKAMTVNYMGKTINAEVSDIVFDGSSSVDLNFNVDTAFTSGTLKISNSDGDVIRTINLNSTEAGYTTVAWDGKTNAGKTAAEGNYTYTITAKDSSGTAVTCTPMFAGVVEGISYKDGDTYLYAGGVLVPLDKVTNVLPESS